MSGRDGGLDQQFQWSFTEPVPTPPDNYKRRRSPLDSECGPESRTDDGGVGPADQDKDDENRTPGRVGRGPTVRHPAGRVREVGWPSTQSPLSSDPRTRHRRHQWSPVSLPVRTVAHPNRAGGSPVSRFLCKDLRRATVGS